MSLQAPHRHIPVTNPREQFALRLFDNLWIRYRSRVRYVRMYESLIAKVGATFVNDHIAFRTIAHQKAGTGISTLAGIFMALGFARKACYEFPDKHLSSVHLAHPNPLFPKLFISELKGWELSAKAASILDRVLSSHRSPLPDRVLSRLYRLDRSGSKTAGPILKQLIAFFQKLPWRRPSRAEVEELDRESQFGAWVILNGYDVNHFTALVNSHGVARLDSIDKTIDAMRRARIPMKKEIEGAPGSVLRQSSTESVVIPFSLRHGEKIRWSYAYFEIAERGWTVNPSSGKKERFEGFLGPQATHLFDMTKLRANR